MAQSILVLFGFEGGRPLVVVVPTSRVVECLEGLVATRQAVSRRFIVLNRCPCCAKHHSPSPFGGGPRRSLQCSWAPTYHAGSCLPRCSQSTTNGCSLPTASHFPIRSSSHAPPVRPRRYPSLFSPCALQARA